MKKNAIIRIVVYSLGILLLLGVLLGVLDTNFYLADGRIQSYAYDVPAPTESPVQVKQEEISTQVQNIEIEWVAGSITIHQSDSLSNIIIEEYCPTNSEHETVVKQSGQTLKIQFSDESIKLSGFGINAEYSKDLVIRVPKNWNCNTLEIDAAAADVNIQDLTIREMDFDGASGNLILDNCNVTELDVDTASGYVEFIGALEKLDFDAASAEFYGEFYEAPRSLNMDSMSGDLEIVLPEDSGFEMEKESLSGTFGTDFEITTDGNLYKCGDGACKIKINAVSGNVSILKGVATP